MALNWRKIPFLRWSCTLEHETHVEYQSVIKDLVLVSEYLAG